MKKHLCSWVAGVSLAILTSHAATVSVTFPEVDGPLFSTGFPLPPAAVSTELFSLPPGAAISSATLEGTFGATSTFVGSTAHHALLIDGVVFGGTGIVVPDPFSSVVPFSFTLPNVAGVLDGLLDGDATLSYIQTSPFRVRFSETTLTIEYDVVGVPDAGSTAALLALAGVVAIRRRRR